jgi:hypothetical protein
MPVITRLKRIFLIFNAFALSVLPAAGVILMTWQPALAQSNTGGLTVVDEEGSVIDLGEHDSESEGEDEEAVDEAYLEEFEAKRILTDTERLIRLEEALGSIQISPQDQEKLRNFQVDVRVTDYLISLVMPEELGGYGFDYIKVGRLFKNYDTDGIGRFDREGGLPEEDDRAISTHHRGQAVDISEVGKITCKLVERRHLGGSTTRWQKPRAIKVAWQSVDGIARNPTPKSPSLMETAGSLSAEGILRLLNESGEMDAYVDFARGLSLEDVLTYVGMNILLKGAGATRITGDPFTDNLVNAFGWAMLEKNMPDLPDGLVAQDNGESVTLGIARARLEEALNLPPGSLRGKGWDEVLGNVGERSLEGALGLPTLFFERHTLEEANALDSVRAALRHLNRGDEAFDFIDGTIESLERNDQRGLIMAGVNAVASAFKLTSQQKAELEAAVRGERRPNLSPSTFPVGKEFPIESLALFFSENPAEQSAAIEQLEALGREFLQQVIDKTVPQQFEGITTAILSGALDGKIDLDSLKRSVGEGKLLYQFGLEERDLTALGEAGRIGRAEGRIAEELNKEYSLSGDNGITPADVDAMAAGNNLRLVEKIGGAQADLALGWDDGTGFALISGSKTLEQAAQEIFANSFGAILGLNKGTEISLAGDLQKNYGVALVEQTLGIKLDRDNAAAYDSAQILRAFGLPTSRPLSELKDDADFWFDPDTIRRLARADARLGVNPGTSEQFLRGGIDSTALAHGTARDNIGNLSVDALWSYFDLEDRFRLKRDEAQLLFDVIKDWENAPFEQKDRFFGLVNTLIGRSMDARTNFALNFFATYIVTGDSGIAAELLLNEGIRQLAISFGVNLEDFGQGDLRDMTSRIIKAFNGELNDFEETILINQLLDATNIPDRYRQDAQAFLEGDFRTGLASWSSAIWVEFANKYLPEDGRLSYEEMRLTINFNDEAAINVRTDIIIAESGLTSLTEEQYEAIRAQARRELQQESRDNTQYKVSDALLEQASGQDLPAHFSRIMFTGTDAQRAEMLLRFGFTQLDSVLKSIEPSYREGTLEKIFNGELTAREADQLVLSIINRTGVDFGPFDSEFLGQFYTFIRSQGQIDFYTNGRYDGMWRYFDSWLEDTLGIGELPVGIGKSIYYASKNGWSFDAGITGAGGQIIVPSINQLGEAFMIGRIAQWGDKTFGLPAGSMLRIYQVTRSYLVAERAYAASQTVQNAANLSKAQGELAVVVITIALNACDACQQFFASVDKAIAAPPGFTNAAVAGAIAMAFGLGPAGLIAAAVIYAFGVYRVDYLCPIPPPDRYATPSFDPAYDALDYTWGDYYLNGDKPVKDNPAPGENKFDWDDGLPFADGNDPHLWRAWARYNTGRLLEASVRFGEEHERPNKPKQIVTLRRANAEFFYARVPQAFGGLERIFPSVGFGYTQTTTKTTDWVHVAFGGWF